MKIKRENEDIKIFLFILTILSSVFAIKAFRLGRFEFYYFLLTVSLCVFIVSSLRPGLLKPFYLFWVSIVKMINSFLTAIILVMIFYLVVTPIGLILRLCGKDLLRLRAKDCDSYWIKKESGSTKDSYLKQF